MLSLQPEKKGFEKVVFRRACGGKKVVLRNTTPEKNLILAFRIALKLFFFAKPLINI
jgi:hypothetical protein